MYQRILVPIDGGAASESALREAMMLADGKSLLRLVYVVEEVHVLDAEGFSYIDYEGLKTAIKQTGERALAQAAEKVKRSGAMVETALLETIGDDIASVIDDAAKDWPADLIVMGTHGRSGLSRLLLGSIAENVVRGASVPVLLVRSHY